MSEIPDEALEAANAEWMRLFAGGGPVSPRARRHVKALLEAAAPHLTAAAEARGRAEGARAVAAIVGAWSEDTAYLGGSSNPAEGQCAVTAMAIQDVLGGEILRGIVNGDSHYWNRLPNGQELDLTFSQFPPESTSDGSTVTARDDLEANPDTLRRYQHLRARAYAAAQRTTPTGTSRGEDT